MYQKRFSGKPSRFSHARPAHAGAHSHGRPQQGSRRPQFTQQKKPNRGGGEYIDPARFVNKAVITEEVEHFVPEHQFADFAIDEGLKRAVVAKGYVTPTPIQDRAIPHVLKGQDVVGIANTGTGKTAAFLIPLINKVRADQKSQVLIVVPTRELAIQIEEELKGFTKGMKIFSVVCVGGASIVPQIRALRYRNQFVIGTPGRLKDLIEQKKLNLAHYNTIVLDEADRMLDMGFIGDMRYLMAGMPTPRHTLFFSATLSREIEGLISQFLHEPVRISVKVGDTSKNVDQDVVRVNGAPKLDLLHDLLNQKEFSKVLIFGRTKHGVERLSKTLNERGFKSESIHGNKNHGQRQRALKAFKDNQVQILVATDVAARGLDIADVSHVINYDIPATYEDYVHRVGRAGRAGKRGKALTFIEK
ncbi:MAG TPA: DEAD/DEAH box helicase [Candidatus Paceibacterota bacterium]|nr:DEAD/DEAH box helicase [Candidatus Paceibacterota bacterium]